MRVNMLEVVKYVYFFIISVVQDPTESVRGIVNKIHTTRSFLFNFTRTINNYATYNTVAFIGIECPADFDAKCIASEISTDHEIDVRIETQIVVDNVGLNFQIEP